MAKEENLAKVSKAVGQGMQEEEYAFPEIQSSIKSEEASPGSDEGREVPGNA